MQRISELEEKVKTKRGEVESAKKAHLKMKDEYTKKMEMNHKLLETIKRSELNDDSVETVKTRNLSNQFDTSKGGNSSIMNLYESTYKQSCELDLTRITERMMQSREYHITARDQIKEL